MNSNKLFMAFSAGKASTEATFKRYIGVAPVQVVGINPTKAELEKIYGSTVEKEPEYLSTTVVNGETVKVLRIEVHVKTDATRCNGIEATSKMSFFLRGMKRMNSEGTKVQVIDKYGRTAWVTKEEFAKKAIPVYANGPAKLDADYTYCLPGEEAFISFVREYLAIPSTQKWDNANKTFVQITDPNELKNCEAYLGNKEALFKGDFSEVKDIATYQPEFYVKVLFGVKRGDDGRMFQTILTDKVLRNGVTNYDRLKKFVEDRKAEGAYSNVDYEVCPIKEYDVTATPMAAPATNDTSDLPFSDSSDPF